MTQETVNEEAKKLLFEARQLNAKGEYAKALIIGKAVAFDSLQTRDYDLLSLSYLLLADLEDEEQTRFAFLQGAYETSRFDHSIYVRTCYHIVFKMLAMDTPQVLRFIEYIISAADGEFSAFLVAVYSKLTGKEYETYGIPPTLAEHIIRFRVKEFPDKTR